MSFSRRNNVSSGFRGAPIGRTCVCCINCAFFTPEQANSECAASPTCDCARIKLWLEQQSSINTGFSRLVGDTVLLSALPLYLSFCVQELVAFCERTVVGASEITYSHSGPRTLLNIQISHFCSTAACNSNVLVRNASASSGRLSGVYF
jgi:hypothetical protein